MSYIKNTVASVAMLFTSVVLTSCNDFLDCEPLDKITPDAYFNSESDLAAYSIQQYKFPSYLNFDISLVKLITIRMTRPQRTLLPRCGYREKNVLLLIKEHGILQKSVKRIISSNKYYPSMRPEV